MTESDIETPTPAKQAEEDNGAVSGSAGQVPAEQKITYSMSPGLSAFLGANRIGLAVSSYRRASSICSGRT